MAEFATPAQIVRWLQPLAARHGVKFQCVEKVSNEFGCPFDSLNLGMDPATRTVFYTDRAHGTALFHEFGHLLFDPVTELRWLGWEFALAQQLQLEEQFINQNADPDSGKIVEVGELEYQTTFLLMLRYRYEAAQDGFATPEHLLTEMELAAVHG